MDKMYEVEIGGKKVMVNELVYEELMADASELKAEMDRQRKEDEGCGE